MGKMQHVLNVSERYVRHGFLASVRRSEFGKVLFLRVLCEYFGFADLGRVVLPPRRGSALPWVGEGAGGGPRRGEEGGLGVRHV